MKTIPKVINILFIGFICLIFLIFSILIKNALLKSKSPDSSDNATKIYNPQITTQQLPLSVVTPKSYTIKLEDNFLNFYLHSDTETILLDSVQIDTSLFPANDITALSQSISVTTLEEGISLIEDFTSWTNKEKRRFWKNTRDIWRYLHLIIIICL